MDDICNPSTTVFMTAARCALSSAKMSIMHAMIVVGQMCDRARTAFASLLRPKRFDRID
jgi:hypothetical protein